MNLPDRLISWAQNEEMIDSWFLDHGQDCLEAAKRLRPIRQLKVAVVAISVIAIVEAVTIYNLHAWIGTLQAQTRACVKEPVAAPRILRQERKVTA